MAHLSPVKFPNSNSPSAMGDHPNPSMAPLPKPLRQVLESDLFRERLSERFLTNKPPPPSRAVFTKCSSLWPCSKDKPLELTFGFIELGDNKIQSNRQNKVVAAVERFQKKVPSVKFLLEKNVSDATVRITFDHKHPRGKTWSQVGMDVARVSSNEPTMNLSEVSGLGSGEIEEDSNEHGDIAHELLHTLGRVHEHQHPERKFTISISAVVKDTGWSEKDASDNVRKLRPDEVGAYSPLDGASNMMYRIPGEWTDDGSEFQRNNKPSEVDWAWLNLMYPPQDQKLFEDALSKCGLNLNEECRKSILKLYLDGEWERVRSQLTRISNPSSNKSIMGKMWSKLVI